MTYQLRCDRCGSALDQPVEGPMQLVYLVKAGSGPRIPPLEDEVRRRCRGCGFVNVFVPLRNSDALSTV
jgi:hypothetical protein